MAVIGHSLPVRLCPKVIILLHGFRILLLTRNSQILSVSTALDIPRLLEPSIMQFFQLLPILKSITSPTITSFFRILLSKLSVLCTLLPIF